MILVHGGEQMEELSNSILNTIKKLIGLDKGYDVFDLDLIIAINSSFMILNQLGVGPDKPFSIKGPDETWKDFFGDEEIFELAKSYIYLRARLLFDPPSSGVLHEAVERQISEFEWRMHVQADYNDSKDGGGSDEPVIESGDHSTLANRDLPNQHPIEAISGLQSELEDIPNIMTADELRRILQN